MSETMTSLDFTTLNELKEMLEEGLDELLDEYLDDTSSQLAQLRDAIEASDIATIASVAHTLKGSSGNLGINGVYLLCQALEKEALAGSVGDSAGALAGLEAAFEQAKVDLVVYRAG